MKIYLVGGAIRDELLGLDTVDKDWVVVGAHPETLTQQGFKAVGKDFPVFLHPETGEEYALARTERKQGHGYKGFAISAAPTVTLKEDLERRDFTINAMARDEETGVLYDPFNGQQDLKDKQIRHVSPAFIEDPLRVIRAARFAARFQHLGFTIASETLTLMQTISTSGELSHLAPERIWQEMKKVFETQNASQKSVQRFFITLQECNALASLFPELHPLPEQQTGFAEKQPHHDPTLLFCIQLSLQLNKTDQKQHVKRFWSRLKAPKHLMETCQTAWEIHQWKQFIQQKPINDNKTFAKNIHDLLTKTDAFRRDKRFTQALLHLKTDNSINPQLTKALVACKQIDTQKLDLKNASGPEIKQRIQQAQIAAIQLALAHP